MARPMGPVRLKKTNPFTLLLGALLCIFIIYFLASSAGPGALPLSKKPKVASHPLSPPTSPFRQAPVGADGQLAPPPVIHYNLNNVTVTTDPVGNREAVLILTPMSRFYPEYWENLMRLTFPHELITLGFILPKTKEGNAATAALQEQVAKTQKSAPENLRFKSVIIMREDFDPVISSQDEKERHKLQNQRARRSAMAKARNSILFTTLGPSTSWVFWLDADIVETPPSIIQDLALHDKAIIVPNCFQRYLNEQTGNMDERPYDFNNWQDSPTALEMASKMGKDDILLEGYAEMPTYRALMAYNADSSAHPDLTTEINLDGIGGAAVLVKGDVHRDGAMFPPFVFHNLIETEGFAKMTRRLGYQPVGLPNYKVYHYNE